MDNEKIDFKFIKDAINEERNRAGLSIQQREINALKKELDLLKTTINAIVISEKLAISLTMESNKVDIEKINDVESVFKATIKQGENHGLKIALEALDGISEVFDYEKEE